MILEIRSRKDAGLGYVKQAWPMARHHIVRAGRREVRLIVETGETVGFRGLLGLIVTGLVMKGGGL